MTLKDWKGRIQPGTRLRCVYRHYCPEINEVIRFTRTQTNAAVYDIEMTTRPLREGVKDPEKNFWMYFPKAADLKETAAGFELYFPDGKLMSRYEWLPLPFELESEAEEARRTR